MIPISFHDDLEKFWLFYMNEKFQQAAREVSSLLLRTMLEIYKVTRSEVTEPLLQQFQAQELKTFGTAKLDSANIEQLTELFQKLNIFDVASGNDPERRLLKAYNLSELAHLSSQILHDNDKHTLKMYMFLISEFISGMLSFKGWLTFTSGLVEKKFVLDRNTGIMTNPADFSRNVSFKAATFGVMLGHICSEVVNNFQPPNQDAIDNWRNMQLREEELNLILYKSGYDAGANFGEALSKAFEKDDPPMSLAEKIDTWCLFDTSVGWGKFEDHLTVNEKAATISGRIVLRSNFLIAEKEPLDFNICSLMTGYVAGVLEKLLSFQVKVKHDRHSGDCGQYSPDKKSCDFYVLNN